MNIQNFSVKYSTSLLVIVHYNTGKPSENFIKFEIWNNYTPIFDQVISETKSNGWNHFYFLPHCLQKKKKKKFSISKLIKLSDTHNQSLPAVVI